MRRSRRGSRGVRRLRLERRRALLKTRVGHDDTGAFAYSSFWEGKARLNASLASAVLAR